MREGCVSACKGSVVSGPGRWGPGVETASEAASVHRALRPLVGSLLGGRSLW